jgi:cell fate regulator YaaT (PSP1 superfamily)
VVHLVKTGVMGLVGRYRSVDHTSYPRNHRVICRTDRGLEYGEVICEVDAGSADQAKVGELLRAVSDNDEMILERLQRHRDRAFEACRQLIAERSLNSVLVDVEHLFDGQSLFFYFLGDVDPELESLTEELAEAYEAKVQFKKFAESLVNGCGPDCGSKEGGCSSGGCGSCKLSGSCGK